MEVNLDSKIPQIMADQQELEQVFVNLFKNAAEAMEETSGGGMLSVSSVQSQDGSNAIVVKVEDSGPGIPQDKLEQVFESFFTTKGPEKGTGLGLSVSKGIIERHGGTIAASNRPDGGSLHHNAAASVNVAPRRTEAVTPCPFLAHPRNFCAQALSNSLQTPMQNQQQRRAIR